jgi:hypothetical protein
MERNILYGTYHDYGTVSCGWIGSPYITQPTDVSFENIQVREGAVYSVASGYLSPYNNILHEPGSWFSVGPVITGKGHPIYTDDTILFGPFTWTPYDNGTFIWNIPRLFKVVTAGGTEKQFTILAQVAVSTPTGKLTVTKGVTSISKELTDPTSHF